VTQLPRNRKRLLAVEGGKGRQAGRAQARFPRRRFRQSGSTCTRGIGHFVASGASDLSSQVDEGSGRARAALVPVPRISPAAHGYPRTRAWPKSTSSTCHHRPPGVSQPESLIHAGEPLAPSYAGRQTYARGDGGPCSTGTSVRPLRTCIRLYVHYRISNLPKKRVRRRHSGRQASCAAPGRPRYRSIASAAAS
jgi:hypothetical protein